MTNAVQSSAAIPATNAVEASTAAMNAVGIVPAGITDAADAISTTVSNPVAAAKEVVSNLLEKGSTNITNEPVSSVGTSPDTPSDQQPNEGGFSLTIPVLVVAAVIAFFAVTRKKSVTGTSAAESEKAPMPSQRPDGAPPTEPRSGEMSSSSESGLNIPSAEAGMIADDVLAAVAPDAPDRAVLRAALLTMIAGGAAPSDPRLSAILRIDESFEKRPGLKYLRRVSILRRKDGTSGSLAKVESEIGWEYVPDAVRGEFIRTRGDKVARRIFDAEKAEKK